MGVSALRVTIAAGILLALLLLAALVLALPCLIVGAWLVICGPLVLVGMALGWIWKRLRGQRESL